MKKEYSCALLSILLWSTMATAGKLLLGEKLAARKAFAIVLSFVGVMFVAGPELLLLDKNSMLGMGLCFGAAVSYGLFTALSKKRVMIPAW